MYIYVHLLQVLELVTLLQSPRKKKSKSGHFELHSGMIDIRNLKNDPISVMVWRRESVGNCFKDLGISE